MSKWSIQNNEELGRQMENERIDYLKKSEAIEFASFVTNDHTFQDFWCMSGEAKEEVYREYLKEKNKDV